MSHLPIIEWSPENCLALDPSTGQISQHVTPTEALRAIGSPKRINLALGRRQYFQRSLRLPDLDIDEVRNLVRFRLEELFPVPPNELAFDIHPTESIDSEGREFVVFATRAETLKQARALFQHAGSKIESMIPAGLGSILCGDPGISSLVIAPCAEGTSFDVITRGNIDSSRVTHSLSTTAEMETEIRRNIAAGGQSSTAPLAHDSLRELVSPNVRTFSEHPLSKVAHHPTSINLRLPEDLAKAAGAKLGARKRLVGILAGSLCIAGVFTWMAHDEDSAAYAKVQTDYNGKVDRINARIGRIRTESTKIEEQMQLVSDGLQPRQSIGDILTIAANATPDGLWLTGASIERGKDLSVRGTALSNAQVAAFVDTLSATPRLREVKLAFSNNNNIGDTPVVQFSVTAHVVGNLPLAEPRKETRGGRSR